ncbi:MAG: hypothetical protein FD122_3651 [Stygiobacter sp.]|nr:MAG: hypothetical protein FD122_3651 [Stygiobacter sp.]KAF0209978.1 MAG: hypothetical protein FD178_3730 [Ignavibacteria bacterium]
MNAIRNSVLGCFSHFEIALFQYREKANEAIGRRDKAMGKHFDFAQSRGETEDPPENGGQAGNGKVEYD